MENTSILIVEDNVIFSMDLKNTIEKFGFKKVHVINRFNNIVENIIEYSPSILIMDISLSNNLCGIELVKEVSKQIYLKVIYITGHEEDEIILKAIDTKPLAYLTKPIKKYDLKAFLFLIIKQNMTSKYCDSNDENLIYMNEDFSFDINRQLLFYKNKVQKLGAKEAKVLSLLIRNKGELVLFKTFEDEVWGNDSVSNDSIRGVVSRLRKRIGSELIESVYSLGFKIN